MAYVPPSLRKKLPLVVPTSIDASEFPSLSPKSISNPTSPVGAKASGFKQVILDRIEKELLDNAAQQARKIAQTDPQKMTESELDAAGWAILRLGDPTLSERFSTSVETGVWAVPKRSIPATPTVTTPTVATPTVEQQSYCEEEEEEYESEYESDCEQDCE